MFAIFVNNSFQFLEFDFGNEEKMPGTICFFNKCKNNSIRNPDRYFVPFVKPHVNIQRCKEWINLCGRFVASAVIVKQKVTSQSCRSRWAQNFEQKTKKGNLLLCKYPSPGFESLVTALPVNPSLPGPAEQFQNWWDYGVKKLSSNVF